MWSGKLSFTCCRYSATRLTAYRKTWLCTNIASFRWWLSFEFLIRVVQWFCKMCSADPKESATGSQVIRGFISVMPNLKFTYSLNVINNFISNNSDISLIGQRFMSYDCYSTYLRTSCTHYASHTYFNVYIVLLRMLMLCILIYLKSFLRCKFFILDNSYPYFIFR